MHPNAIRIINPPKNFNISKELAIVIKFVTIQKYNRIYKDFVMIIPRLIKIS